MWFIFLLNLCGGCRKTYKLKRVDLIKKYYTMKSKRLDLSSFKLKKEAGENGDVSKLMGNVLGQCHDEHFDTTGGFTQYWDGERFKIDPPKQ